VPPAITALDGPGSEGLGSRQTYTVTVLKKIGGTWTKVFDNGVKKLIAVPSNVGPRTMPSYQALAQQGIYDLGSGVKVFAGTVDDPFYIDLGATFDSINYRPSAFGSGIPAVYTANQDEEQAKSFSADDVSGYNVNVRPDVA
jgi:hypothetical protein